MNTSEENCKIWRNFFFFEISKSIRRQEIYYNDQKNTKNFNDTHMEPVLYWIQYKNSLKYKVGCFWRFSYVYTVNQVLLILLSYRKRY